MKIEIKNLRINLAFSEETIMFKADIYINSKKTFYASNDGFGGSTSIHGVNGWNEQQYQQVNEYLKPQGHESLDDFIDDYVCKEADRKEREKFEKKKEKLFLKGIVISKSSDSFEIVTFGKHLIAELLSHPSGVDVIKRSIQKYKAQGYNILNKNIPQHLIA